MKREIGGYFELEQFLCKKGAEYHKDSVHLNLGRNALEYLIKCKNIQCMYLPYLLCNSIKDVCKKNNVQIKRYHINKSFKPIIKNRVDNNEYIYVVNYYGFLSKKDIIGLKTKYKNLIVDNVQAFFEMPVKGVDTLYSCRKFFGVPDGSYLYSSESLDLSIDNSKNRFAHLKGRLKDGAEMHYFEFINAEKELNNLPLLSMSDETYKIMCKIDYSGCKKARISNYGVLERCLSKFNEVNMHVYGAPFCYPLLLKDGLDLKKRLISSKVFIPTLWPGLVGLNSFEQYIVNNMVLLPCDHRYDKKDMEKIISIIYEWDKNKSIHVRELSLADLKIINKWHNDKNIFNYLVGNFYGPNLEESEKWIRQYLKHETSTFRGIVSTSQNVDLGVVYLINDRNTSEAEIGIFIADKKNRNIGYGKKMLLWLIDFGFNVLKFKKLFLYTLESNLVAINLYKKMGFIFNKSKNKIINKNGTFVTAIYMYLKR